MKKEDWVEYNKRASMIFYAGIIITFIGLGVGIYGIITNLVFFNGIAFLLAFFGGIMIGEILIHPKLIEEYEKETGKKW